MAITLLEVAKLADTPLRRYVLMNLVRQISIMELLPFTNVNSLTSVALRWTYLPDVAFRRVNSGYTASEGAVDSVYETVYGFGGEIHYDRVFDKLGNMITDPRRLQTDMKLRAMAIKFNDHFINGDHATEPDGFEGLKKRVANMPSSQSIYFAASNAAALDPTASVANANLYFNKLQEMAKNTNGGAHNAWFCNQGMKWGAGRVARYVAGSGGNFLSTTKDNFDREIPTLYGSPILDIGTTKNMVTEIITETETAGDGGADATSMYCTAFGEEEGISGIQLSPAEVYDPLSGGEMESKPVKMIRIDWWVGLAGFGSRGTTRGRNIEGASNWT